MLKKNLSEFNIRLEEDIIAVISDGAALNIKMGNRISKEKILFLSHGIHLCVCKVLKNYVINLKEDEESSSLDQ